MQDRSLTSAEASHSGSGVAGHGMGRLAALAAVFASTPGIAHANPVDVDPSSVVAFWVVVLFALVVEAGVATLTLAVSGIAPVRLFLGFLAANAAIYFLAFRPLLERETLPLAGLECGVVLADAAILRLLCAFEAFQSECFTRVTWAHALLAAGVGNGFSYFVGRVASHPF
jgi:hypothetical protein